MASCGESYWPAAPDDAAFLAMTHHQLGHVKEAQAELQRLREWAKDPRAANNPNGQHFLREAEALLASPKATDRK